MKRRLLDVPVKVIGLVSLGLGLALTVKPAESSDRLGLPYRAGWTRALGGADAALGLALLSGRKTRRWMHVRALANIGLALVYASHLHKFPQQRSTRLGLILMSTISVTDGVLARVLPEE